MKETDDPTGMSLLSADKDENKKKKLQTVFMYLNDFLILFMHCYIFSWVILQIIGTLRYLFLKRKSRTTTHLYYIKQVL